jgi:hypothetical protein
MSFCLIYDFGEIASICARATSLECDYVEGTQRRYILKLIHLRIIFFLLHYLCIILLYIKVKDSDTNLSIFCSRKKNLVFLSVELKYTYKNLFHFCVALVIFFRVILVY